MSLFYQHLLSAIVLLPLLGALLLLLFPQKNTNAIRVFALVVSLLDFALVIFACTRFHHTASMQLTEKFSWIPTYGINYALAVDGISLLLIILTTFLAPIVILNSYSSIKERVRQYLICLLILQTGMLGAFAATDLFLFYVFWEVMLVPMYFLIGIWGGRKKVYAALKFFLYTMFGSLLMLAAIIYTVWTLRHPGGLTFSWDEIAERLSHVNLGAAEYWLFAAFALAFAIKVPMFPFHTWLPDAHVEAPTGGSVILAGVLLKLGAFGFLRYGLWFFPKAALSFLPILSILAVIGIIYGSLVAMAQTDFKRLVAYSSVAHLGFVMLGLCATTITSVTGGVLQMVNHGLSTGALFLLVGVIYERRHTRELEAFGGLAKVMPRYALLFIIIILSSIGLPGLNGFIGEFLILMGTFQSTGLNLATSTGEFAKLGIIIVNIVALIGLIALMIALNKPHIRERYSRTTRNLALFIVFVALLALVIPPLALFNFSGGLLTRPLAIATSNTQPFTEFFALLAVIAAIGVILAAVYLLGATQKVLFGPVKHIENQQLRDLSLRETMVFAPLVIAIIFLGVFPQPAIKLIQPTVTNYTKVIRQRNMLPEIASDTHKLFKGEH